MVHAVISEIMERRGVRDQMEKESFVLSGRSFESEALWYALVRVSEWERILSEMKCSFESS